MTVSQSVSHSCMHSIMVSSLFNNVTRREHLPIYSCRESRCPELQSIQYAFGDVPRVTHLIICLSFQAVQS